MTEDEKRALRETRHPVMVETVIEHEKRIAMLRFDVIILYVMVVCELIAIAILAIPT